MDAAIATASASLDDRQLERRIKKALKSRRGKATLADVVVDTGIPNIEAERMLRRMIGEYPCHLDVTEDGELLYHFDPSLRRYDQSERMRRFAEKIGRPLWRGFVKLMKALIAIVMVVYVVLFIVLIIAAMIAAQRGSDSSDRRMPGRSHGGGGGGMFWFWFFMFGRPNDPYRTRRYHNPAYNRFDSRRTNKDKRPFYLKVYSFVLGPEAGDVEPELDETALLAYIREKKGVVTTAEVVSRTGWSLERAEQGLTKMVARYEGNIAVSDDGHLVFTFFELLSTLGGKRAEQSAHAFWERWERRMPLTGNSTGTNVLVAVLSLFNLSAGLAAPSMILPPLGWEATTTVLFGLSWFPVGFSALIFVIPLMRYLLHVRPENRRRRARNIRRAAYQQVFRAVRSTSSPTLIPEEVSSRAVGQIPDHAHAPAVTEADVERVLRSTLFELGGDAHPEPDGDRLEYHYDELVGAIAAGQEIRKAVRADSAQPVKVVFSSLAEETGGAEAVDVEEETPKVLH